MFSRDVIKREVICCPRCSAAERDTSSSSSSSSSSSRTMDGIDPVSGSCPAIRPSPRCLFVSFCFGVASRTVSAVSVSRYLRVPVQSGLWRTRDVTPDGPDRLCVSERAQCAPSRVLHLRQLPGDVSEQEVLALGLPFGRVSKLITLRSKNQAFLEMASEEAAVTMVNYYTTATPTVRNQPVFIQYSNHRELKTDNLTNHSLDGQNIYNSCCTLRIDFSKLSSLNVKYNNDKSRDFTRGDLPTGEMEPAAAFGVALSPYGAAAFPPTFHQHTGLTMATIPGSLVSSPRVSLQVAPPAVHSVLLVSNLNPESVSPHVLFILFVTPLVSSCPRLVSSCPSSTVSEEVLKDLFSTGGFPVKAFKFFQKDRKMALMQLASVEEAVEALIALHDHQLDHNQHLRVSFSKSTI
ncbi:hypothetical protein F2P81_016372 [Scophthalmus maximus]|uniref:RRM domain-containing protein n=1 Tax=Scophthalmus maximus TaxID=52904 RepID=A0A6A4SF10_SCOMX|nr:hypothetical protein F2P81_016372 [Scophthalmus maximus]